MQNIFKKIVSLFFCISILISVMCVPASAADDSSIMQDFWEWNVQTSRDAVDVFWKAIYGDDWLQDENRSKDELEERYNQYVSDLQTDLGTTTLIDGGIRVYPEATEIYTQNSVFSTVNYGNPATAIWYSSNIYGCEAGIKFGPIKMPFDCIYDFHSRTTSDCPVGSGSNNDVYGNNAVKGYSTGATLKWDVNVNIPVQTFYTLEASAYYDIYPVESVLLPTTQDISINSRPSSITGDYGILGDDGTIIKVDGTIVDEGHSLVWNPVTNTTYNYTDYAYDYFDRSYNLTLEDGSTVKVVYGDENITIQEGDTIYNVYYLTSGSEGGSGSGGSGDDGSGGIGGAIGGLFDVLGEIVYGLIEGTINLATKALSALTGLLDLLKQFGESIISFFGGYTDFLGAVFPFLPEETFTILNLGLILMIAAAVFKKFL